MGVMWKEKRKCIQSNGRIFANPLIKRGLGIRETKSNDMALLAKTCWRSLSNDDLLCSKTLGINIAPVNLYGNQKLKEKILISIKVLLKGLNL